MRDFHTWLAEVIATKAHEGQVDKAGKPYIDHPRAVAQILRDEGFDEPYIQAGWLHDVVEDTAVTLRDIRSAGFSLEVVNAVDSVTRRPGETYMDMIRRATIDDIGRVVKLADNRHNIDRLEHLEQSDREFLYQQYSRAYVVLAGSQEVTS